MLCQDCTFTLCSHAGNAQQSKAPRTAQEFLWILYFILNHKWSNLVAAWFRVVFLYTHTHPSRWRGIRRSNYSQRRPSAPEDCEDRDLLPAANSNWPQHSTASGPGPHGSWTSPARVHGWFSFTSINLTKPRYSWKCVYICKSKEV